MKAKILFTSPCGPYEQLPVEEDPIDYFYYRNTYRQKMFQLRSFQSWHSLHFLAQNIPVASVVLENPDMERFQDEIRKGEYQLVAIGFTILLGKKVLEMMEWLKLHHPDIEIVLGGYGTAIFRESFELSTQLRKLADHICDGEGLKFMNSLVESKWKIKNTKPLQQELLPARNSFFRTHIEIFRQIVLVGGLGCVSGCSFCATSSQFKRKHIPLFSGKELFESLLQESRKYPGIQSALIYEEDFLLNRAQVLEFIKHYQSSELRTHPLLLTIFASLKSITNYSMEELISCGIGTIFIGVESLNEEVLQQEGLGKREGRIHEIFQQLHQHGINTLGSLVIGWDSQTADIAKADSERFIELQPTFYQVVPLHVVPGTMLWEEMKKEGRISKDYRVESDGISKFNFQALSYPHAEAQKLISSTYSRLVKEGGPWPFRVFVNLLKGYQHLKKKEDPILSTRAGIYRSLLFPISLLAFTSRFFFFGKPFSQKWKTTMVQFFQVNPWLFVLNVILSPFMMLFLAGIYLYGYLSYHLHPKGDQPDYIRVFYEGNAIERDRTLMTRMRRIYTDLIINNE